MNAGVQNLVISLGAMQCQFNSSTILFFFQLRLLVARKIPFEDPEVLNYVRIAYVAAQVIILGAYYYVSYAVRLHTTFNIADVCSLLVSRLSGRMTRPFSNMVRFTPNLVFIDSTDQAMSPSSRASEWIRTSSHLRGISS